MPNTSDARRWPRWSVPHDTRRLSSLTGLRRAAHVMRAAKRGITPLQHAADVLAEQQRHDAVTAALADWRSVIARHAQRQGRSFQ
jgi:hypothetical protein